MKLKLEQLEACTMLSIEESLAQEQLAVIQAGLNLIFQTSKHPVLIDLSTLSKVMTERLASRFLALKAWAACQDRELFVISPLPELGDVPTREAGLMLAASSSTVREALLEKACARQAAKLERQKRALIRGLSLKPKSASLRSLRKINSGLRKRVAFAKNQIQGLIARQQQAESSLEGPPSPLRTAPRALSGTHDPVEKGGA